ncbi:glycosyl hydrolase family 18 protein [Streptomyces xiaopingdaonensis]|uniref:glycosyl hydrolase family 18 protein n=1 Tax=Streptomyces xiaopingdaonensis TaxID=1565415 RepID=UPI0002E6AF2C|nr:glycosyl hydrolase family 18 protein [Streptomyces xiaopingdaonensis]
MHRRRLLPPLAAALVLLFAAPTLHAAPSSTAADHRTVVYYQTQFDGDTLISPKELTNHDAGATDVIVGAVHLTDDDKARLNDDPHDAGRFDDMWSDLADVQSEGVHVLGMVGGAAQGSFTNLENDFDAYYPKLKEVVEAHGLDGLDLDVEEEIDLSTITRLIDTLRADFGDDFLITLAPVATALKGGGNLSGFGYDRLYEERGDAIDWFNTQFYCGWGSLQDTSGYDDIVDHGVVPAEKVVAGTVTNSAYCDGHVPFDRLTGTLSELAAKYPDFGGAAGWEYAASDPGGSAAPWEWAEGVSAAMR